MKQKFRAVVIKQFYWCNSPGYRSGDYDYQERVGERYAVQERMGLFKKWKERCEMNSLEAAKDMLEHLKDIEGELI